MTRMYIANATQQMHRFMYRLPESPGEFQLDIPPGGQVRLPQDLRQMDVDAILKQHTKYGMVESSVARSRRNFSALCYALDRMVQHEAIRNLIISNNDVLVERGKRIRQEAGVAIHQQIEDMMARQQMPDRLIAVEATAQEDSRDPQFAEGVHVTTEVEGSSELKGRAERPHLRRPSRSSLRRR